jgi:hypothetical protein
MQNNNELEIVYRQSIDVGSSEETLNKIWEKYNKPGYTSFLTILSYQYGVMQGKREERAKRKKQGGY